MIDLEAKKLTLGEIQKDSKRTPKAVVVLTFWCSFCASCRRVEHSLDSLAKEYEGTATVMAIDASAGETAEGILAFAKKKGLSVPIVMDPTGHAADLFGTQVTTTTVVIDGDGVLRYCGRFSDGKHRYAENALKAVLAGEEVKVKTTEHDG
jgi:thiol-disulfide isomerase/thioredoxin